MSTTIMAWPRSTRPVGFVAVLVALVAGACDSAAPQPVPPASAPAATVSLPVVGERAPDGGTIRVVERGITAMTDRAGSPMASYAVIVENTSTSLVAANVRLVVRMTDSAGAPVTDRTAGTGSIPVYAVLPGQRIGIGRDTYVDKPGAAAITVEVGQSQWWAADPGKVRFAEATTSTVKTQRSADGRTAEISFTVTSQYAQRIDNPAAHAVFRDRSGAVIGGTSATRAASGPYPTGESTGRINAIYGIPASTDDTRTEVYVSPSPGS